MPRLILITMLAGVALVAGAGAGPARAAGSQPLVLAMRLNTEINPVSASFVKDSRTDSDGSHAPHRLSRCARSSANRRVWR